MIKRESDDAPMDFVATQPHLFQMSNLSINSQKTSLPSDTQQTDSSNGVHQTNEVFALMAPFGSCRALEEETPRGSIAGGFHESFGWSGSS